MPSPSGYRRRGQASRQALDCRVMVDLVTTSDRAASTGSHGRAGEAREEDGRRLGSGERAPQADPVQSGLALADAPPALRCSRCRSSAA